MAGDRVTRIYKVIAIETTADGVTYRLSGEPIVVGHHDATLVWFDCDHRPNWKIGDEITAHLTVERG